VPIWAWQYTTYASKSFRLIASISNFHDFLFFVPVINCQFVYPVVYFWLICNQYHIHFTQYKFYLWYYMFFFFHFNLICLHWAHIFSFSEHRDHFIWCVNHYFALLLFKILLYQVIATKYDKHYITSLWSIFN